MGATVAKASSIPDYNQNFPDFGTKVLETWGREGNLAREMANRLLMASGNVVEARRKDASDFEQAKELAALKQKYAAQNIAARAKAAAANGPGDVLLENGQYLVPLGSAATTEMQSGLGVRVGTKVIGKKIYNVFQPPGPEGVVRPTVTPYTTSTDQAIPSGKAPVVTPPPPPAGPQPTPAGLKPYQTRSGKIVYYDEQGNIVNVPK